MFFITVLFPRTIRSKTDQPVSLEHALLPTETLENGVHRLWTSAFAGRPGSVIQPIENSVSRASYGHSHRFVSSDHG